MTYEPDELEAALIEGDPEDVIPMDKIRAMAQAVRDAGYVKRTDHEQAYRDGESSGYADWVIAFDNTDIEFPDRIDTWSPTQVAQWLDAEIKRNR